MDQELAINEIYTGAIKADAAAPAKKLCTPEEYAGDYLKAVPKEVLDNDFGCGDPTRHVRPGDTVLDLGSGSGKMAYVIGQVAGAEGRVIGVDMNPEMVDLARRNKPIFAANVGYDTCDFHVARIQDLRTDLEAVGRVLADKPAADMDAFVKLQAAIREQVRTRPLIADDSVDLIVSNCVINLVRQEDKTEVFKEMFRVLKPGGRIAISDNVSKTVVPEHLREDPELWAGCYSGCFQEQEFYKILEDAGFNGISIDKRSDAPGKIAGIEFWSVTLTAWKPAPKRKDEPARQVMYAGPWKQVTDDRGKTYKRGDVVYVSGAHWREMTDGPYAGQMLEVVEATDRAIPAGTAAAAQTHAPKPAPAAGAAAACCDKSAGGAAGGCCDSGGGCC